MKPENPQGAGGKNVLGGCEGDSYLSVFQTPARGVMLEHEWPKLELALILLNIQVSHSVTCNL